MTSDRRQQLGRHVPLEGGLNFRDIGGYRTAHGQTVRRGCVYRSADLSGLSPTDLETLGALGIRVVFDLRNETERSARPSVLPPDVEIHERTSPSRDERPGETLEEQIAAGTLPDPDDDYVASVYLRVLNGGLAPEFRRVLELALEAPERPLLFHCAAGKDRTGIAAAILLGILGVSEETIVEDYELTTLHYAVPRLRALASHLAQHRVPAERVLPLLEARTAAFRRALQHLNANWDGYDGYAVARLGLDVEFPEQLRARLTA